MGNSLDPFSQFAQKMKGAGLGPEAIARFKDDYLRFASGEGGFIREEEIEAVSELPQSSQLAGSASDDQLSQLVVIKLNGGLGTSMGLDLPKGALAVKEGLSFLAIAARQVAYLQATQNIRLPLLLMNSYSTRDLSLRILQANLAASDVARDFLQSKVPKIEEATNGPARYPTDQELEWCPPGHGEIYAALRASGLLEDLIEKGYRYAFVSNVDNLGACTDQRILRWFAESGLDFAMEVTARTEQDRKGGHLARRKSDGRYLLREVAQCPPEDSIYFEDITRHRFFNTNNLWLNLSTLRQQAEAPRLPLIVNRKTVNPADLGSTRVIQLETAMGAAISWFPHSAALAVDRSRFMPVKNTTDLLLLASDLYDLGDDYRLRLRPQAQVPQLSLDPRYYRTYQDFQNRFPKPPSLSQCESLTIDGDVSFQGPAPIFQGRVSFKPVNGALTVDGPGPFCGDYS